MAKGKATLHLMVAGGLCSRFRTVVGASAYCEVTGKELVIHWPPSDRTEKLGSVPFPVKMSELWDHSYTEINKDEGRFPKDITALDGPGDVRLRTCHLLPFLPYMQRTIASYIRQFQPTAAVQGMVRSVLVNTKGPTVGVIVRWCDRNDPKDLPGSFVDRMSQIVKVCPDVRFYLTADCVDVDELIHKAFPGRVTALKHDTDYKYDRKGIMRTLADLYIVAACDWVIGTRRSSYAQMAAFMRGGERVCEISLRGSVKGGRYEASDNPGSEGEMLQALGVT